MELTWHDNKHIVLLKLCITTAHINTPSHLICLLIYFIGSLSLFNFCNSQRGSLHLNAAVCSAHLQSAKD